MNKYFLALGLAAFSALGSAFAAANTWTAAFVPSQIQIESNVTDGKTFMIVYNGSTGYGTLYSGATAAAWYDMAKTSVITNIPIQLNYDPDQEIDAYYCDDWDSGKRCPQLPTDRYYYEFRQMVLNTPK